VNSTLGKVGLAPALGIGNVANTIPALRKSIASKLGAPLERTEVFFVAPHYVSYRVSRFGDTGGAPFHLTALVDGEDVTGSLDLSTVFDLFPTRLKRITGVAGQDMTAASAITVLDAVANHTRKVIHAPGPNGLP